MKLTKETKLRVLENFYALDYIFFGKPLTENKVCCPLVAEEYLTTKGALMSVFVEMVRELDHNPKPIKEGKKVDSKVIVENAKKSAKHARENSVKILSSNKGREYIKESLKQELSDVKDVNVNDEAKRKIQESAYKFSIDNLLIARTLQESKSPNKLAEWDGQLIEDAYKLLRDSLVESAMVVLEYDDEE
ncbi:MAG: hypothetical protein ACOC2W_00090 [bacterium]